MRRVLVAGVMVGMISVTVAAQAQGQDGGSEPFLLRE